MNAHQSEGHALSDNGIAIIGLGGCFPDAPSVAAFWDNIRHNRVAIDRVPDDRWDVDLFYSSDRQAPDKTYSCIGGFIKSFQFDAKRFRIPPRTLAAIDDLQKMALMAVYEALEDARLEVFAGSGQGRAFDRDRTAVILGNAMGGEAEDRTSLRVWFSETRQHLERSARAQGLSEAAIKTLLEDVEMRAKERLPKITEDSMPGELSNCITGRICNLFDLRGPNFTTDAACAASMAALQTAVQGLQHGTFDTAIVGGADRSMDPPTYVKFSKIGALSPNISAPFDARANGFIMGEGVGIIVLKRLADAVRDGDRIYAVVRGVGSASDGKGKGITAPNPRGQRLAVDRAYADAGVSIDSIGLFEAHGTSTTVGDGTELQVLNDVLESSGKPPAGVPIGSVKSMIGHLKSAAGAASVIKAALALHHKVRPPSANFRSPPPNSPLEAGYLRVCAATEPWPQSDVPRRAAVSAFGFGGTNFHAILEEAPKHMHQPHVSPAAAPQKARGPAAPQAMSAAQVPADLTQTVVALFAEKTGYDAAELALDFELEADLGIDTVKQAEILGILRERYGLPPEQALRIDETPTLRRLVAALSAMMAAAAAAPGQADAGASAHASSGETGSSGRGNGNGKPPSGPQVLVFGGTEQAGMLAAAQDVLQSEAWSVAMLQARAAARQAAHRLAFWAETPEQARQKLAEIGKRRPKMLQAQGIFLADGEPFAKANKVAFLFPGQGSQYLGMFRDLANTFKVVRDTFEEADAINTRLTGQKLTDVIWPAQEDEAAELNLRHTQNCQPAMLTADVAMLRLLQAHGVHPDMVAGHSLGEYAAAVAAGVMTFGDALYAVSARGREMAGVQVPDNGKMAMVAAPAARVQEVLDAIDGYVIAANKNCHTQTVIAGASVAVDAAVAAFGAAGIEARQIPVSHAFHCSIVAPAAKPLVRVLDGIAIQAPRIPILSNVDASYYPDDKATIVQYLAKQLASPVEFIAQIERMYEQGARIFVEVGPRRAVTGFVRNILGEREHRALASNHHKRPALSGLLELLAALASDGVAVQFDGNASAAAPSAPVPKPAPAAKPVAAPVPAAKATTGEKPKSQAQDACPVVISGLSVALPSPEPIAASLGDGLDRLLAGENFIAPLQTGERQEILDYGVTRLNKAQGRFEPLREVAQVLGLAARFGELDLVGKYGMDENLVDAMDSTGRFAVAVGLDALRNAGIPLVRRYRTTSTGSKLPDRWALPAAMSARTGVIFATAFPGVDRILEETARFAAAQASRKSAQALADFAESWAQSLQDPTEATRFRAAFAAQAQTLGDEAAAYQFNRKWLFRALSLGHAQLAQSIVAQGPNTQINAACASGTQAIGLARDWVRLGHCDRVLVVTADDVTKSVSLPWFGAGFLAAGAATVETDLSRAAVPFGADRNGLILGAAASGFVVEAHAAVLARGMQPLVEIVAARTGNSAFHGTRLDGKFICGFMDDVVSETCAALTTDRDALAKRTFFMSHETYTPARGGSSAAEVDGLRHAFGAAVGEVLVANTKGFTGHPMAATLEDAVAIGGLQRRHVPAVANLTHVDPAFADLRFSKGGPVSADVAIRFAAGFGSQVAMAVYRQCATTLGRLAAPDTYMAWLSAQTGREDARLEMHQRILRVAERGGSMPWELGIPALERVGGAPAGDKAAVLATLVAMFSEHTGYEPSDLQPDHALEADLGIDTVKQAEIFAAIRGKFALAQDPQFKLSEVQTLNAMADYLVARSGAQTPAPQATAQAPGQVEDAPAPASAAPAAGPVPQAPAQSVAMDAGIGTHARAAETPDAKAPDSEALLQTLVGMFAEHTGYDIADLSPDHALEADLGIDTVKQAEIFALVRKRYGLVQDETFRLSDVPTLRGLTSYIAGRLTTQAPAAAPPIASPAPVAHAEAVATDRAALMARVLALFVEHTGYDIEDLAPDQQLEADLGIDTVKQAEIFGKVRGEFALPKDEQLSLSTLQTLDAIVDYVAQRLQTPPVPQPPSRAPVPEAAEDPSALAPAPAPGLSKAALVQELVAMFAEHTGYDKEDLHPEHALEADLGIDTVKQAEIIGMIRKQHAMAQDAAFSLSQVGTIDALADYILGRLQGADAASVSPSEADANNSGAAQLPVADARFTARLVGMLPATLAQDPARTLQNKRIILAGGQETQRRTMRTALVNMGAQVHLLSFQDAAAAHIPRLGGTPADGLVYLVAPTSPAHADVQERVVEVFGLLRAWACGHPPDAANLGFLAVGDMGHAFGLLGQHPHAWVLGALAGMAKSYAQERPQSRGLAVDWHDAVTSIALCEATLGAWLSRGPSELIRMGDAWQTLGRTHSVQAPALALRDGATVVATGGAQGVTYLLLRALAQKTRLRITILARTTGVAADKSPLHGQTPEAQKALAQAALAAAGERVTPMAVRRWLDNQHKRVQIAENLQALRALGSEVELVSCDISNSTAVEQITAGLLGRLGACDLLLHGAGVEESKLIADKDTESMVRAYAPKAAAALQLWQMLKPRRMVTMGSVAGRFGNVGQVDYAAANETLAALARAPGLGVLNLAWTAWRDVGMATRGSTRQVLEQVGVDLLPTDDGVAMGAGLIQSGAMGDVVVAGALGTLAAQEVPYHAATQAQASDAPAQAAQGMPLLRLQSHDAAAQSWTFARRFDPQQDPGLLDHRIDGTLVIPGVVGLEMVVQSASYVLGKPVRYVRDVRFALPIKLFRDAPMEVYTEVHKADGQLVLSVCSNFVGPNQRKIRRVHYSAVVPVQPPEATDATPTALEMACDPHIAHADIYKRYFHGPRFQVLEHVHKLGDNGADGYVAHPMAAWLSGMQAGDYASAPWLREAGFQVAGLWEMAEIGRMALPSAIDELYIGEPTTAWEGAVVRARRRRSEAQGCTFDVFVCDAQGQVRDVMLGYRTIAFRDLSADERFDPARPPQDSMSAGIPNQLTVPLKEVEALFSGDLESALEHYLVPMEIARFRTLKLRKRQLDWLAVRIAAKRLIRESYFGREAAIVPYNAIAIHKDALGAPVVEIIGDKGVPPNISMSHSAGIAAAFLSHDHHVRCGIDVESVQERDPTFAQTYFSAAEQAYAAAQTHKARALTALWAVKEATLKALGVGARVDFRDVEVTHGAEGWRVTLHHEAAKRADTLGASAPQIEVDSDDLRVMARVLLPVSGVASSQPTSATQVRA